MPYNLISDRWLPCRRASGARVWLAPHEITSEFEHDPVLALDFPRPDWNASVTELLIGLLSAAMPPHKNTEWARLWAAPPPPEKLKEALAPLTFAFNLDGDGPRCFQDLTDLSEADDDPVEMLLINAPADNNRDLFVKKGSVCSLSAPHAAAALVTLQSYAPGGGRGRMANPRKKGPLTCLVYTSRLSIQNSPSTIWDLIWPNVLNHEHALGGFGDIEELLRSNEPPFPWFRTPRSAQGSVTIDDGLPEFARFFSLPRRVRLLWHVTKPQELGSDDVGLCCERVRQRPYGHQYGAWRHPLSPYRLVKGEWRAMQCPSTYRYENWTATWGLAEATRNPDALLLWPDRLSSLLGSGLVDHEPDIAALRQQGLRVSGFIADPALEAKVLGWLDERIPYFEPPAGNADWPGQFQKCAGQLVGGAREAASRLRFTLRLARFGKRDGEGYKLLDSAPKDAFEEAVSGFWRQTEPDFRNALAALHAGDPTDTGQSTRRTFHAALRKAALRLFDDGAGTDTLADQDARRIVEARRTLVMAFGPGAKIADVMGIATESKGKGSGKSQRSKRK